MRVTMRILAQHLQDSSRMRVEGKERCRTQDSRFPSLMQRGDLLLSGFVIVGVREEGLRAGGGRVAHDALFDEVCLASPAGPTLRP